MNSNLLPQRPLAESFGRVADQAAQGTDHAIRSTQRMANETLDRLSGAVQRTPAVVRDTAASAEEMALRHAAAWRDRAHDLRYQALTASQHARQRIEHDPFTSVVLAAALGAGLTALWMWLARRPQTPR